MFIYDEYLAQSVEIDVDLHQFCPRVRFSTVPCCTL